MTEEDGEEAAGGGGFSRKDGGEQTAVIFPQPRPLFISKVVFFLFGFVSFVSVSFHLFMLRSVLMFPKFCGFFCFCFDELAFGVLNVYAKRNFYGV